MSARRIPEPRLPDSKRQFGRNVDHGFLLMKNTFEHAELSNGAASGEPDEDRLRNEKDWLRMDDEGRPKRRQPSHPR
jgi:hypothetical protein